MLGYGVQSRVLEGTLLEVITRIGVVPPDERRQAGEEIQREEQKAPTLVLRDVDTLMCAVPLEKGLVGRKDDMPERDGERAAETTAAAEPGDERSRSALEHSRDETGCAAHGDDEPGNHEPDEGGWRGPEVPNDEAHGQMVAAPMRFGAVSQ